MKEQRERTHVRRLTERKKGLMVGGIKLPIYDDFFFLRLWNFLLESRVFRGFLKWSRFLRADCSWKATTIWVAEQLVISHQAT